MDSGSIKKVDFKVTSWSVIAKQSWQKPQSTHLFNKALRHQAWRQVNNYCS